MQNTHTLFPSIMFLHDLYFLSMMLFTHTSPEREKDCGVRRFGGNILNFMCVCVCVNMVNEWQNEKLNNKGSVRRGER